MRSMISRIRNLSQKAGALEDRLLFPWAASCLLCEDPVHASDEDCLCGTCRDRLSDWILPPMTCPRCLSRLPSGWTCKFCKQGNMRGIDFAYSYYQYDGSIRKLIHQLKFDVIEASARALADGMEKSLGRHRDFDVLVPVPLHRLRLRERGMNQSLVLANELSFRIRIPVEDALIKVRNTKKQSSMSKARRAGNVAGAYVALPSVQGKRVLLIDDVRTTGNTARVCAEALLAQGARSVCLCTAAVVW